MTEQYDYNQDIEVGANLLRQIAETAKEYVVAEAAVADAAEIVKQRTEVFRNIKERVLPELMAAASQKSIVTADDLEVKIAETVRASIPEEMKPQAFPWLTGNGHGSVIKFELRVELPRGADDLAKAIVDAVKAIAPTVPVEIKQAVHPQTLAALIRELLADEKEVPMDILGAHVMTAATVKPKKSKRK